MLTHLNDLRTNDDLDYDNHQFTNADIPELIALMQEHSYVSEDDDEPEDDYIWRSSIHAFNILGKLGDAQALPALIAELAYADVDDSLYVTEDLPRVIATFGPSAVDPLIEVFNQIVSDESMEELNLQITSVGRSMVRASKGNDEAELKVIALQAKCLAAYPDCENSDCLATDLVYLKRPEVFAAVEPLFEYRESVFMLGTKLQVKVFTGAASEEERQEYQRLVDEYESPFDRILREQREKAASESTGISQEYVKAGRGSAKAKAKKKAKRKLAKASKKRNRK